MEEPLLVEGETWGEVQKEVIRSIAENGGMLLEDIYDILDREVAVQLTEASGAEEEEEREKGQSQPKKRRFEEITDEPPTQRNLKRLKENFQKEKFSDSPLREGFPKHMQQMKVLMAHRYFEMSKRVKTFERNNFPINLRKKKYEFARAGFVFTGLGDVLHCFANGCVLNASGQKLKSEWHDELCPFSLMVEYTPFRRRNEVGGEQNGFVRSSSNHIDWGDPSYYNVRLFSFGEEANPFCLSKSVSKNHGHRVCAENGFMWDGEKVVCAFGGPFGGCELDMFQRSGEQLEIGHFYSNDWKKFCPFARMRGIKEKSA